MNELIELPIEVNLRIEKQAEDEVDKILKVGKTPKETAIHLISAYGDLVRKTESEKWFTAERNKNTFNQMVLAYELKIEELNEVIQKKVERLNP
jgi:DNA polymerase III delta subunit